MYSFANDAPATSPGRLRGRVSGGGGEEISAGGRTDMDYGGGVDRSSRGGGGGGKGKQRALAAYRVQYTRGGVRAV